MQIILNNELADDFWIKQSLFILYLKKDLP